MPIELIILLAAMVVSWLVFTWLIKVVKASVNTAFAIAIILLILQLLFGIAPPEIWQQIKELPQIIKDLFLNN